MPDQRFAMVARYEQTRELLSDGRRLHLATTRKGGLGSVLLLFVIGFEAAVLGADGLSIGIVMIAAALWSGLLRPWMPDILAVFSGGPELGEIVCTVDERWLRFRGARTKDDVSWVASTQLAEDDGVFVLSHHGSSWKVIPKSGFADAGAIALFRAFAETKVKVRRLPGRATP